MVNSKHGLWTVLLIDHHTNSNKEQHLLYWSIDLKPCVTPKIPDIIIWHISNRTMLQQMIPGNSIVIIISQPKHVNNEVLVYFLPSTGRLFWISARRHYQITVASKASETESSNLFHPEESVSPMTPDSDLYVPCIEELNITQLVMCLGMQSDKVLLRVTLLCNPRNMQRCYCPELKTNQF